MARLIEDYGLIGDGETAALVNRNGSIDWLCWPRFDSDACFAALLGSKEHGYWQIAPDQPHKSRRRYQQDTLVLETDFETDEGAVRLIDFMPIRDRESFVVRMLCGLQGSVGIRSELRLRFDYGSVDPWIRIEGNQAFACVGPDQAVLYAPVRPELQHTTLVCETVVHAGDELVFALGYGASIKPAPEAVDAAKALTNVQHYWREWISQLSNATDWPEAVRRSLITLKALIYRPSGAILAAATTSLPEAPGGELNWDYRFAWLRDATFTLTGFIDAGFKREAIEWRKWLLRSVAGDPEKMRIMYRIDGSRRLEEWTASWLPGFRSAWPVRIGNAASTQRQLDIYGEVMDSIAVAAKAGIDRSEPECRVEDAIVEHVKAIWLLPDQGLWELRGRPRHYVYSKVSAWVAIDRYVSAREGRSQHDERKLAQMSDLRREMHQQICREGYDPGLGRFVEYYGGHDLDASLLLLPLVAFLPVDDERIGRTIEAIERELVQDGLVRRWKETGANPEGAFLACTCWLAECQMLQGRHEAARRTFERVLAVQNDLGLLAEEYNVPAKHLAGNFPQALTHLALVRTALRLCGEIPDRRLSR